MTQFKANLPVTWALYFNNGGCFPNRTHAVNSFCIFWSLSKLTCTAFQRGVAAQRCGHVCNETYFISGVVPGQQSSPQFIIAPHMGPMPVAGSPAAAGGQGGAVAAAAAAAQAAAAQNQMQGHGPPAGPGGPQ